MILKAYSLFDCKAALYGSPFFIANRAMALRSFQDLSRDQNTMVFRHPTDFVLYEIGEYDDLTGVMKSFEPENLGNAVQFRVSNLSRELAPIS